MGRPIMSRLYCCATCRIYFHPSQIQQQCCSRKCAARSKTGREQRRRAGVKGGRAWGQKRIQRRKLRSADYRKGYNAGLMRAYEAGKRAGWAEACGEKPLTGERRRIA